MKKIVQALLLILTCAAGGAAYFDADPSVIEVKVIPGGSISGRIKIKNVSKMPLEISAKVMDWRYEQPSGSKQFLPAGTSPLSCAKWLTLTPMNISLKPGESQAVSYNLTASSAARGGYYAVAVFSASVPEAQKQSGVTVNLALQMGTLILVEIENTQLIAGQLTAFGPVGALKNKLPVDVEARFKNTGNVRVEAKGRLSIVDAGGNSVGWTKFPPIKTLPGDEWLVTASWSNGLPPGRYKLIGTFELAPDQIIVQEKEIEVK